MKWNDIIHGTAGVEFVSRVVKSDTQDLRPARGGPDEFSLFLLTEKCQFSFWLFINTIEAKPLALHFSLIWMLTDRFVALGPDGWKSCTANATSQLFVVQETKKQKTWDRKFLWFLNFRCMKLTIEQAEGGFSPQQICYSLNNVFICICIQNCFKIERNFLKCYFRRISKRFES